MSVKKPNRLRMMSQRGKNDGTRLWLAINEMDKMFANKPLTTNFMDCLHNWQTSPFFLGFLGIGSHDLVNLHLKYNGSKRVSPFNLCNLFKVQRFSNDQMNSFFKLIEGLPDFTDSTRRAIMDYSSGAPGVFGSLIRFTIDSEKCSQERHEWESWFKIQDFSDYLGTHNWIYRRIQRDLQRMGEQDWKLLTLLLWNEKGPFGPECNLEVNKLLQMGIVVKGSGTLEFSSEMMRRVCLESVPVREITQVANADDPLELLAASLQFMNPKAIGHALARNRLSPCEVVFQFELYASIRGIFKANNISDKTVLAEAQEIGDNQMQRLEIIIDNGVKYGYELKSNLLEEEALIAAVERVDGYRKLLGIGTMFMVNFIPRNHSLEKEVYEVSKYDEVKIIHAFFPDTCDEFDVRFQGADGIENRTMRCVRDDIGHSSSVSM